jgi:hypothetical protein
VKDASACKGIVPSLPLTEIEALVAAAIAGKNVDMLTAINRYMQTRLNSVK